MPGCCGQATFAPICPQVPLMANPPRRHFVWECVQFRSTIHLVLQRSSTQPSLGQLTDKSRIHTFRRPIRRVSNLSVEPSENFSSPPLCLPETAGCWFAAADLERGDDEDGAFDGIALPPPPQRLYAVLASLTSCRWSSAAYQPGQRTSRCVMRSSGSSPHVPPGRLVIGERRRTKRAPGPGRGGGECGRSRRARVTARSAPLRQVYGRSMSAAS